MAIKHADCKIREARQRIVAIDRAISDVGRAMRGVPAGDPAWREADAELRRLRGEREAALLHLEELLILDEWPAREMARVAAKAPIALSGLRRRFYGHPKTHEASDGAT